MQSSSMPWWRNDEDYVHDMPLPSYFVDAAGPRDVALVRVWGERTQEGWGLNGPRGEPGFMPRYLKDEFAPRRSLYAYEKKADPFAIVMRSVKLICVDIDGKNGGFDGGKALGNLPITLAERSKSGNGYHLFYATPEDEWDETLGFSQFTDRIGIEQGVDIRAVGCVFHHASQRWNGAQPAPMPEYLAEILRARDQRQQAATERIAKIREGGDIMEVLMLKDELIADLQKPIPAGKRNTTLFAIGQKLREADVDGWEVLLQDRGQQVGLPESEVDKIIENINRYGGN
jgi:hypothetical protein